MRKLTDDWALVGVINPGSQTASEKLTAAIDMSKYLQVCAVVAVGTLGTAATVDATWKTSATSGGTYNAVSGKSITQLTKAGTDDNKQVAVNLRGDEMGGNRYAKFSMTPGTAASDAAVLVFGLVRYAPATEQDLSTVDEVI